MFPEKKRILIIYSTTDGQCKKIADNISKHLDVGEVTVISIEETIPNIKNYDGVIIGASIRYGYHKTKVKKYINQNYEEIQAIPNAFYSISLIARKPERQYVQNNPYVKKFLSQIKWKPECIGIFGGVLNYSTYSFLDKYMIKLIMHITKGPTDLTTHIEYTDWVQVQNFAEEFNKKLL